jgi:hypothetical protein
MSTFLVGYMMAKSDDLIDIRKKIKCKHITYTYQKMNSIHSILLWWEPVEEDRIKMMMNLGNDNSQMELSRRKLVIGF